MGRGRARGSRTVRANPGLARRGTVGSDARARVFNVDWADQALCAPSGPQARAETQYFDFAESPWIATSTTLQFVAR
jgi:hypothetical protein